MKGKIGDNFIECETIEDANSIPLSDYTYLERQSAARNGAYCFKIRQAKK